MGMFSPRRILTSSSALSARWVSRTASLPRAAPAPAPASAPPLQLVSSPGRGTEENRGSVPGDRGWARTLCAGSDLTRKE